MAKSYSLSTFYKKRMQPSSLLDIPINIINFLYFRYLPEKTRQAFGMACRAFFIVYAYDIRYRKIAIFIKEHFKLIDSFPKNTPLSEIVQFSRLIMLGENHTDTEQKLLNDCLTSVLWKKEKNSLLLESYRMGNCLSNEIKDKAQIWDKGFLYLENKITSIHEVKTKIFNNLFDLLKDIHKDLRITRFPQENMTKNELLYRQHFFSNSLTNLNPRYSSILKTLSSIQGTRNWYLLNNVIEEIKKEKLPILYAGSNHVENHSVLLNLKKNKIPFISLVANDEKFLDFTNKKVQDFLNMGNAELINFFFHQSLLQRKITYLNSCDCRECYPNTFSMLDDMRLLDKFLKNENSCHILPGAYPKLKHTFFHFNLERINGNDEHVGVWVDLGYLLLLTEKNRVDHQIKDLNKSKI